MQFVTEVASLYYLFVRSRSVEELRYTVVAIVVD
jgi:hypothetical protein